MCCYVSAKSKQTSSFLPPSLSFRPNYRLHRLSRFCGPTVDALIASTRGGGERRASDSFRHQIASSLGGLHHSLPRALPVVLPFLLLPLISSRGRPERRSMSTAPLALSFCPSFPFPFSLSLSLSLSHQIWPVCVFARAPTMLANAPLCWVSKSRVRSGRGAVGR